jgi:hypothetical protein
LYRHYAMYFQWTTLQTVYTFLAREGLGFEPRTGKHGAGAQPYGASTSGEWLGSLALISI